MPLLLEIDPTIETHDRVIPVSTSVVRAVRANPSRVGIVLSNLGSTPITLSMGHGPGGPQCVLLPPASSPFVLLGSMIGPVVQLDWYAVSSASGGSLGIVETVSLAG